MLTDIQCRIACTAAAAKNRPFGRFFVLFCEVSIRRRLHKPATIHINHEYAVGVPALATTHATRARESTFVRSYRLCFSTSFISARTSAAVGTRA